MIFKLNQRLKLFDFWLKNTNNFFIVLNQAIALCDTFSIDWFFRVRRNNIAVIWFLRLYPRRGTSLKHIRTVGKQVEACVGMEQHYFASWPVRSRLLQTRLSLGHLRLIGLISILVVCKTTNQSYWACTMSTVWNLHFEIQEGVLLHFSLWVQLAADVLDA